MSSGKGSIYHNKLCIVGLLSIIACTSQKHLNLSGTWLNDGLDHITILEDSIEVGYGYAIPSETLPYEIHNDTFVLKPNPGYGDPNDGFKCRFTYHKIDTHQIVISSDQEQGFFGLRSGSVSAIFTNTKGLFYPHSWDSLVQNVYITRTFDSSEILLEKMVLLSDERKILLRTQRIDSMKNGTYEATIPTTTWTQMTQQISFVDSSFFQLLQSEVSDGYLLEIKVYRPSGVLTFAGYDFPMIFKELRHFLCCDYHSLEYHVQND